VRQDYRVFMAMANHIGHDKRGNTKYVRDENGNEVIESRVDRIRDVRDGMAVIREVESATKVVDDNTLIIAARFRDWLQEQL
jgi:type I restriction enzyme M protein